MTRWLTSLLLSLGGVRTVAAEGQRVEVSRHVWLSSFPNEHRGNNGASPRLDGRSEGFCVIDDVGHEYSREGNTIHCRPFPNRYFASREGRRATAPFFTRWTDDGPVPPEAGRGQNRSSPRRRLPPAAQKRPRTPSMR